MFTAIANLIGVILSNWIISLCVLVAFIVLFIWLFKGLRVGLIAMLIAVCAGSVALLVGLAVTILAEGVTSFVAFLIAWVPTALFVILLLLGVLLGIARGLRKNAILMAQSLGALLLCVAAYFICVNAKWMDAGLLNLVNKCMNDGTLQQALGVSAECETLREVLADYLPKVLTSGMGQQMQLLLSENGAYLMTLVDVAYHVALAVVFYVFYLVLVFLLYLVYLIFYSERKYRKKKNHAFAMGTTDSSYKKHRIGGGVVGLFRGLIIGLITLSFIGSAFFVVAGGTGDGELGEYDFGNENTNTVYEVYRSVESYGASGIYKVLNAVKDPDDSPYYLFAADLVFSGQLNDEKAGIKTNVNMRKELGAYTGFARETMDLLLKYGGDDVKNLFNGTSDAKAMDVVLGVMSDSQFQLEFENLIENFDAQTYIINFALSLANTVIANLDDMAFASSISDGNKELLKMLFQKGYLSETIPEERELREELKSDMVSGNVSAPPCLSINHLFNKQDARVVLRIVLSFLTDEYKDASGMKVIGSLLPQIESLSIMNSSREKEINPVLGRLYCYLENKYLTPEGESGITYTEIQNADIAWTKEIHSFVEVTDDLFNLYENIKRADNDIMQMLLSVFDINNAHYAENVKMYERVSDAIADSAILGKIVSSGKIMGAFRNQLKNIGDVYIPTDIVFENTYTADGELLAYGEMYHFFRGLRLLGDEENNELINVLLDSQTSVELTDLLDLLADAVAMQDEDQNTLGDYIAGSQILRSVVSAMLIEQGEGMLVIPESSCDADKNGVAVPVIKADQILQIFDCLPRFVEIVKPFIDSTYTSEDIEEAIKDETIANLLDAGNGIAESTIASVLVDRLKESEIIVIPAALQNASNWTTVNNAKGELRKIIDGLKAMDINVGGLIDGTVDSDEIFDTVLGMTDDDIEIMLESNVLQYTVSNFIDGRDMFVDGFSVIAPQDSGETLQNDVLPRVIRKSELASIIKDVRELDLSSEMDVSDVLMRVIRNKSSIVRNNIISASIINFFVKNEDVGKVLSMPVRYRSAGDRASLENYSTQNIWYAELPALIDVFDEVFGVSAGKEEIDFSEDGFSDTLSDLVTGLNEKSTVKPTKTKLDVCYTSAVMTYNLSEKLDDALKKVVDEVTLSMAKDDDGIYLYGELQALSDTVNIFKLDLLDFDDKAFKNDIEDKLLTFNDPLEDYQGRTTLDIMYSSVIIQTIVSDRLDDTFGFDDSLLDSRVLARIKEGDIYPQTEIEKLIDGIKVLDVGLDNIDSYPFADLVSLKDKLDTIYESALIAGIITKRVDDSLNDDMIDRSVLIEIKRNLMYEKADIAALLDAMIEMEKANVSEIEGYSFSDIKDFNATSTTDPERKRLDVLYDSRIVAGLITKAVRNRINETNGAVYHTDLAYINGLSIYEKSEIESILSLLGDEELEEFRLGAVSRYMDYIAPDENGKPKSYLISATVSRKLIAMEELVVPASIAPQNIIDASELVALLNAFTALRGGSGQIDYWEVETDLKLPAESVRETLTSSIIMRATFTLELAKKNEDFRVNEKSVETDVNVRSRAGISIIDQDQILAIFEALDVFHLGNDLKLPVFQYVYQVADFIDSMPIICKVDEIRYTVTKLVKEFAPTAPRKENAYYVRKNTPGKTQPEAFSISDIVEIFESM